MKLILAIFLVILQYSESINVKEEGNVSRNLFYGLQHVQFDGIPDGYVTHLFTHPEVRKTIKLHGKLK